MIIRPVCRKEFIALPNSLFNDRRLSADTRAMIAVLLSKPRGWELRPAALAKLLSREGETPIGRTRLNRMFAEATAAGYMARSAAQSHNQDGTWGKYEYFVGMPDDVLRAVQRAAVAIAPQSRGPHEGLPHAQNDFTNHKEKSSQKTELKNANHLPRLLPPSGTDLRGHSKEGTPRRRMAGKEVVQHRLASRLGIGDAGRGWLIMDQLRPSRLDELTALERVGRLTDIEVSNAIASVSLAVAKGTTS